MPQFYLRNPHPSGKGWLEFFTEMLFNIHCYFHLGQNLQEPVVFMKSHTEDLEFYFSIILGVFFSDYAIYIYFSHEPNDLSAGFLQIL